MKQQKVPIWLAVLGGFILVIAVVSTVVTAGKLIVDKLEERARLQRQERNRERMARLYACLDSITNSYYLDRPMRDLLRNSLAVYSNICLDAPITYDESTFRTYGVYGYEEYSTHAVTVWYIFPLRRKIVPKYRDYNAALVASARNQFYHNWGWWYTDAMEADSVLKWLKLLYGCEESSEASQVANIWYYFPTLATYVESAVEAFKTEDGVFIQVYEASMYPDVGVWILMVYPQ